MQACRDLASVEKDKGPRLLDGQADLVTKVSPTTRMFVTSLFRLGVAYESGALSREILTKSEDPKRTRSARNDGSI